MSGKIATRKLGPFAVVLGPDPLHEIVKSQEAIQENARKLREYALRNPYDECWLTVPEHLRPPR